MDLYLLRHAEAGEAPRDEDRELTERGRAQARAVAAGISWLDMHLDTVLSSPLPRALQTAEAVATAVGLRVETTTALATGRGPREALALLEDAGASATGERVLMVGHEPQLSLIVQAMTGGRIHVRKAMLARLELPTLESGQAALAWLLSWRHLGRLGRTE